MLINSHGIMYDSCCKETCILVITSSSITVTWWRSYCYLEQLNLVAKLYIAGTFKYPHGTLSPELFPLSKPEDGKKGFGALERYYRP